jgi:hypothetical protein
MAKARSAARRPRIPAATTSTRYFCVQISGAGGEFLVGTVPEQFVEHWKIGNREYELVDYLASLDGSDDDYDEDYDESYPNTDDNNDLPSHARLDVEDYHELGDIEHDTMLSADDAYYTVVEIKPHPHSRFKNGELQWNPRYSNRAKFDWSQSLFEVLDQQGEYEFINVKSTHLLHLENNSANLENPLPCVMIYDQQKGKFGHLIVETQGEDFDPALLQLSVVDASMGRFISEYRYRDQHLSLDITEFDTWNKGFLAAVGYLHLPKS